jgi:hypothetical protein
MNRKYSNFCNSAFCLSLVTTTSLTLLSTLLTPVAVAQSNSSALDSEESINLQDGNLNPFDLWHRVRLQRKDADVFQEEQEENLNSEVSDFRARQLEQLRQQQAGTVPASTIPTATVPAAPVPTTSTNLQPDTSVESAPEVIELAPELNTTDEVSLEEWEAGNKN